MPKAHNKNEVGLGELSNLRRLVYFVAVVDQQGFSRAAETLHVTQPTVSKMIAQLEQSQRQSLEIIEKLAQQNAQVVATVGALRIGAQRLAWACAVLFVTVIGLVIALLRM